MLELNPCFSSESRSWEHSRAMCWAWRVFISLTEGSSCQSDNNVWFSQALHKPARMSLTSLPPMPCSTSHLSTLTDSLAAERPLHCLGSHRLLRQCIAAWGWQWRNWALMSLVLLQHPVPGAAEERQEKSHWINNSAQDNCGLWQMSLA